MQQTTQYETLAALAQVIEVWTPNERGDALEWLCADYGLDAEANACLRESQQSTTISPDEGIVGRVWGSGCPEVRQESTTSQYHWENAALQLGLSNQIAIPVVRNCTCIAVLLFLCDDGKRSQGAFEIWGRNEREELSLEEAYHANLDRFGRVSKYVKFPRRAGLPGITWEKRHPQIIEGLGTSKNFIRAAGARAEGLSVALSFPIMRTAHELDSILLILSSSKTPLARAFEIWVPTSVEQATESDPDNPSPAQTSLRIQQASYGPYIDLAPACRKLERDQCVGLAGKVYSGGLPWITDDLASIEPDRADLLQQNEMNVGIGIPVYVGESLEAVVVMIR